MTQKTVHLSRPFLTHLMYEATHLGINSAGLIGAVDMLPQSIYQLDYNALDERDERVFDDRDLKTALEQMALKEEKFFAFFEHSPSITTQTLNPEIYQYPFIFRIITEVPGVIEFRAYEADTGRELNIIMTE